MTKRYLPNRTKGHLEAIESPWLRLYAGICQQAITDMMRSTKPPNVSTADWPSVKQDARDFVAKNIPEALGS